MIQFRKGEGDTNGLGGSSEIEGDVSLVTTRISSWITDAIDEFRSEGSHLCYRHEHDEVDDMTLYDTERW